MPVAPLMIEHRLIERVVKVMGAEAHRAESEDPDPKRIEAIVDFMRTYADRCHHGKEEDILFAELGARPMPPDLKAIMGELVEEHKVARRGVRALIEADRRLVAGEDGARRDIARILSELAALYPKHIEKEDKRFFVPCMDLFTEEERKAMLERFREFDGRMIHEKYRAGVEALEAGGALAPGQETAAKRAEPAGRWQCEVCDYIYDPAMGDPEHGVAAGTAFEDLPEDWVCPVCGAAKSAFKRM